MPQPPITAEPICESTALRQLLKSAAITAPLRHQMETRAVELVERIREDSNPGMMELFLGEYGLSSDEGVALMCLAEALLRVPDGATMDALIEDKIAPSSWGQHLGQSHSSLVNASTWALFVTGKVLEEDESGSMAGILRSAIKRLGEPVIRQAVTRVMKEMGRQFVLGETIEKAMYRAKEKQAEGFTYSYDMLGEAARTDRDARRYHLAYSDAISELAKGVESDDIRENPGISIKLSALHPRYETVKKERVMEELVPRARSLAMLAKSAGIGLNIDAEEAARLDLSLDVIEAILSDPVFKNWDGFGIVVQAYGLRAPAVIDWLYELATRLDRRIMVRLVKGAYWDTEIKLSQVQGHEEFPVFTRKASTDVSYICCAKKLLGMTDRIYPQFATHNAHTVAAILEMAQDKSAYEFQRLQGMGEALHDTVLQRQNTRCRIYAPVGAHKDLLAYLVRRLLENGANSSFVNQIVDEDVPPAEVAADPFAAVEKYVDAPHNPAIAPPANLFAPERQNSRGWDISDPAILADLENGIARFDKKTWNARHGSTEPVNVRNPATGNKVGQVAFANAKDAAIACDEVRDWSDVSAGERADILRKAADLYEDNCHEIFSLLIREAGKTLIDCISELREAVDFLRYYANDAQSRDTKPAGIFASIAPWNFPLAIFSGQMAAALASGNGVLAKPAETTTLLAHFSVSLLHKAGVPKNVLKLVPGAGAEIGPVLTSHRRVNGVCFTGSTATAQSINRSMAANLVPHAPLIAETGGLNAMIVDSTALPEQAVRDVLASAFQSAGQRCSALRVLYVQEDIADNFMKMLFGAMDELQVGNPRDFATDVGPIITEIAARKIQDHIDRANADGRLLKQINAPKGPNFVAPAVISVSGIEDLAEEIFGPVLHIATYGSHELDTVIDAINAKGFGLTFGLHSRIDDRVQHIVERIEVGNIYINRNQIGAVVGSQPFGGEGLSGTGPKAGGPRYLDRFYQTPIAQSIKADEPATAPPLVSLDDLNAEFQKAALAKIPVQREVTLPGPTGESNRYTTHPRRRVLCLGPTALDAQAQWQIATDIGCEAVAIAPGVNNDLAGHIHGVFRREFLGELEELDAVIYWGENAQILREQLADRPGPIIPLLMHEDLAHSLIFERHLCIDTTAAGGNAALLEAQ